jgi:hypothetical protein
MNPLAGRQGLRNLILISALVVVVLAVALWATRPSPPRSAAERQAAATELLTGIRISTTVSGSDLAASKALVDFLAENDVRLVLVRVVDELNLEVHIETNQAVAFKDAPSFCLIGPFAAPDDAGYSSPCWGTPETEARFAAQLPVDDAGHPTFPAGEPIVLSATVQRGGPRCDYPPGSWLLRVEADPLIDGLATGARQLAEVGFDVPWSRSDRLPSLPVSTVAYCGLANTVYREQGEPAIASSSP